MEDNFTTDAVGGWFGDTSIVTVFLLSLHQLHFFCPHLGGIIDQSRGQMIRCELVTGLGIKESQSWKGA